MRDKIGSFEPVREEVQIVEIQRTEGAQRIWATATNSRSSERKAGIRNHGLVRVVQLSTTVNRIFPGLLLVTSRSAKGEDESM